MPVADQSGLYSHYDALSAEDYYSQENQSYMNDALTYSGGYPCGNYFGQHDQSSMGQTNYSMYPGPFMTHLQPPMIPMTPNYPGSISGSAESGFEHMNGGHTYSFEDQQQQIHQTENANGYNLPLEHHQPYPDMLNFNASSFQPIFNPYMLA